LKTTIDVGSSVISLAVLSNSDLASGSYDATVIIWDSNTWSLKLNLVGHTKTIWSLVELQNGNLASASEDNSIRIWETSDQYYYN
jgi:WD40 repeat protein